MVKRTVVVLGIFSLILLVAADSSMAFGRKCFGGEFMCPPRPMYLPVDCPGPVQRTIVAKWECNIEGPCPPVMPAAGCCSRGRGDGPGLLCALANLFGAPFDAIMAGRGGVYGCSRRHGGVNGPCGSPFPGGFMPGFARSVVRLCGPQSNFFGGLW